MDKEQEKSDSQESPVERVNNLILDYYHAKDSDTDKPITESAHKIAEKAFEAGTGICDLEKMLTSEDAKKVINTSLHSLVDKIFEEFMGGVKDGVVEIDATAKGLSTGDLNLLKDEIYRYTPELRKGKTVSSFLRDLFYLKCLGDASVRSDSLRDYLHKFGVKIFQDCLLSVAVDQAVQNYSSKLSGSGHRDRDERRAGMFEVKNYIGDRVREAHAKTKDPKEIITLVAIDCLKARIPYEVILDVLLVSVNGIIDGKKTPRLKEETVRSCALKALDLVRNEIGGHFLHDVTGWYSVIAPDTSVVEVVQTLTSEAIENGYMRLQDVQALLNHGEAVHVLEQRVKEAWNGVFNEFSGRKGGDQKFTDDDAVRLKNEMNGFAPKMINGWPSVAFLRGLISSECFGVNKFPLSVIKKFIMDEGFHVLFPHLLTAANVAAERVFESYLSKVEGPEDIQRYVGHQIEEAMKDPDGLEAGLVKRITKFTNIAGLEFDQMVDVVENNLRFAGYAKIARKIRRKFAKAINDLMAEDSSAARSKTGEEFIFNLPGRPLKAAQSRVPNGESNGSRESEYKAKRPPENDEGREKTKAQLYEKMHQIIDKEIDFNCFNEEERYLFLKSVIVAAYKLFALPLYTFEIICEAEAYLEQEKSRLVIDLAKTTIEVEKLLALVKDTLIELQTETKMQGVRQRAVRKIGNNPEDHFKNGKIEEPKKFGKRSRDTHDRTRPSSHLN